jgi:hypothetical protein
LTKVMEDWAAIAPADMDKIQTEHIASTPLRQN